jgi:hypothetical protein
MRFRIIATALSHRVQNVTLGWSILANGVTSRVVSISLALAIGVAALFQ